jgi:23S rRNA pseudouridine1911/1915/1917 synthase
MNISILFEDADILIIDKPAGITVNKSETTKNEVTIQDWAEDKLGLTPMEKGTNIANEKKFGEEGWDPKIEFYNRGGIVHRLDKETSGVLILAKNPAAFQNLQNQFKEKTVKKTYNALAHGKIIPKIGEINVPVGRLPWNRKSFGIIPGGRESKTLYKVL